MWRRFGDSKMGSEGALKVGLRGTLVGGECFHHCAALVPHIVIYILDEHKLYYGWNPCTTE